MADEAPSWFTEALDCAPEHGAVVAEGARITFRAWGPVGAPVTVLVHGGAAHAGWWDHVGPLLLASSSPHRVVALDLSGHGDSDWRDAYALETWAAEVLAVAEAQGGDAPPVVIGHSMGGFVALTAARDHGDRLAGVVAVDSPVRTMSSETRAWLESHTDVPPPKVHPDRATILGRFRTLPTDDASLDYVVRHVAAGSIREAEGGWSWKFDPRIFVRSRMEPEELAEADCPVALLRGDRGMASTDITDAVAARLGGHVPVTVVRDSGHHVMLDQPLALTAVVQAIIGEWRRP
jgi:pimeloyl-ACP methyl ester carboxylesterase